VSIVSKYTARVMSLKPGIGRDCCGEMPDDAKPLLAVQRLPERFQYSNFCVPIAALYACKSPIPRFESGRRFYMLGIMISFA
jgi:hypothetical protein